ncbi:MAG: MarR family transcriptional regulator [Actinomycetota bacterium]|nr:MarR family transcriptional regulator [Actinomycetota bacterium]
MLVTILEFDNNVSPAELGRALLMERSTVSRNLRRLEAQGLVEQHVIGGRLEESRSRAAEA